MDSRVKRQWDFLLQCRPNVRGTIGNSKLVGGEIIHNSKQEKIFHFITTKGTFIYNETADEFKKKLEIP